MASRGEKTERDGRSKADMDAKPQTEKKHPDEWEGDLNPDRMAGQNLGAESARAEKDAPTAHHVKDVYRRLRDAFTDDELKQITILAEGQRLQQGARYLDLNQPDRGEFVATGDRTVGAGDRITPKAEVPYSIWNRLTGVENPERIPERGPGEEGEEGTP